MKGKKIFIYLLVLALLTTSISGSGLENVFASDKSTTSESTTEEQDNTSENSVPESDDETGAESVSGEENYTDEETPDSETSTVEATEEENGDGTGEEPAITSENMNGDEIWERLSSTSWVVIDEDTKNISVKDGQALTLLSNCPADKYKDYTISKDSSYTGNIMSIPATAKFDGVDYQFQGLGTKEVPFAGKFNIDAIKIPSALFGGLSSAATFAQNKDKESLSVTTDSDNWKTNSSVLAESYVFADDNTDTFDITVSADAGASAEKKVKGSLIGEISGASGTLKPELRYSSGTAVEITRTGNTETANAGLICNTLCTGTLDASSVSFPTSYSVSTDNGSAGGVVGEMQSGTNLVLQNPTIGATVTGTIAAGGIAGSSSGVGITVKDSSTVGNSENPVTIKAAENAGGLIGKAENTTITVADGKNITVSTKSVTVIAENGNAGGVFGYFSCQNDFSINKQIKLDGTATVKGNTAGGLVGVLVNNSENSKISVGNTDADNSDKYQITSCLEGQNLGGLIGQYSQTNAAAALEISKVNVTFDIKAKADTTGTTYGGLIGLVQNQEGASSYGYVKVEDVTSSVTVTENAGNVTNFGGLIGATGADGYFLDFGNVAVTADNGGMDAENCGGLVGNLESGVLRLQGTTDLSNAKIKNEGATKGQLVGYRNNALIYALGDGNNAPGNNADKSTGWTLKRSEAVKVSDIGSYGEVYRQGDKLTLESEGDENALFTVDFTNHTVTVPAATTEISSAKDFAAIAIRAQLTENGVVKFEKKEGDNFDFYAAGTALNLKNDIDLTGTGITGFMRDNGTNQANTAFTDGNGFKGNLKGNNHTITLSIGESYGIRGILKSSASGEGSGQIYRHKNTGLFAVTAGAIIQNVKTAGTITVDSAESGSSYCGALAAQNMGSSLTIRDCSTDVTITYAGNYADNSKYYVGGLVGEITAGSANAGTLTMTGNTISGTITLETPEGKSVSDAYMGGMISAISRSTDKNNDKRIISPERFSLDVSNTTVSGLEMTSSATVSMGGLLGYEWNNVAVTWKNVVIKDSDKDSDKDKTSLTSNGNANFGGLVYQATGYWNVEIDNNKPGIDIQEAAFTGNATTPDGLLVYSGRQSENSALYLEIKKDAYKIGKDNVTIIEKKCAKFDELIGVSMKDSSNGQGVVSLATSDASDSDPRFNKNNECTTYQNVTKNKNTTVWDSNENTRYYYNLDLIRKNTPSENGDIENEEQLLTWSVRRYAATNIKGYFGTHDGNGNESVQFKKDTTYDLTGYSYYPVSVGSEENLTFDGNGATIKFDNESIDTKEETKENTTTVMKTNTASQHRLMHFGLFLDFKASAPTEIRTYTLTAQNMKLTGNVGGISDSFSGALLCGTVAGAMTNTTINTHGLSVSGITMENLYVAGYQEKDSNLPYAPLLINQIGSYTAVSLNSIKGSYTKSGNMPEYAASSLIGNAGSEKAQNISLSFSSIALQDGAKSGESVMFSRAMLLNSFRYKSGASGAATYNFNLADDWNDNTYTHNNATYGKEISESTEYQDEEHWYYDTRKDRTNIYVNTESPKTTGAAGSAPEFKKYKPYVYASYKVDEGYHEIKVNVYVVDILNGCGTYGHPFQIDSAEEMVAIAEYMRTGTAGSGWKIRLSKDFLDGNNETLHNDNDGEQCSEYTYNGTNWAMTNSVGETESILNSAVREYMRNAYYQITKDIPLDSTFCGFGYDNTTAFRGVIVGKDLGEGNYPTITLPNSSLTATYASHGLINNSYGSVVMNLNIKLDKENSKTVTLNEKDKSEASVKNYYGSVMGQILGGDNFIDNVKVEFADSVINITGTYKHLVPVGGYVGIIQGGCLIFRNMGSDAKSAYTGLTERNIQVAGNAYDPDSEEYFYINHYVGRVLDGCAFYEKAGSDGKNILNNTNDNTDNSTDNNTDKNYQIATIDSTKTGTEAGITTKLDDDLQGVESYPTPTNKKLLLMTTTVEDAQSLLILSAITNSGAAGGGMDNYTAVEDGLGSYAYYGKKNSGSYFGNQSYGKARNASYQYVGQVESTSDFATSVKDDHNLVSYKDKAITLESNTPYLVTKYTDADKMTYFYAGYLTRVSLEFKDSSNFDMSTYGSGYRGIGGRYRSAAVQTGTSTYNADRNTPFTRNFNGNGNTLTLSMDVKEYCNDNYHAIGVGGVFNVLQQNAKDESKGIRNELSNITISGNVQLSYDPVGGTANEESYWKTVGVGGLVGRSANRNSSDRGETYYADIKNVTLSGLNVSAPYNAGGIVGLGGFTTYAVSGLKHSNSSNNCFAAHFTGCSINNITINSSKNAGGLFGWSASSVDNANTQNINGFNHVESCTAQSVQVQKSTGENYADSAGVFFGKCDGSLTVTSSEVKDSSVKGIYAGMLAGQIRYKAGRTFAATDTSVSVTEDEQKKKTPEIQAQSYAGGLVGYSAVASTIERCTVSGTAITANTEGGLLGEVTQPSDIYGCKVSGVKFKKTSDSTTSFAGALVGKLSADLTGGNLLWDTNSYEESISTRGTWIGSSESSNGSTGDKVQLAGVSRRDTTKSTSLKDVGSGEYNGYISYADYTVKNESAALTDSSVNNSYPEAKFDKNNSLTLAKDEFIYLGEGNWTIETGSESFVQIEDKNLLKAKAVGTATVKNGDDTYTIKVVDSLIGTTTLLQNGTYEARNVIKNGDEKSLDGWFIIDGYLSSDGKLFTLSNNVSSVLKIPMKEGYTYRITYGVNDGSGNYPWKRMRLKVGKIENNTFKVDGTGWMSKKDKDSTTDNAKSNYTFFEENEVVIQGKQDQYIFLNYDNASDYNATTPDVNYKFKGFEDQKLFKSITVTRTGKIAERSESEYDSLKLISMPKSTFGNGETIDKSKMQFVLCESETGIMRSVDSNDVTLNIDKVTAETETITATYNGLTCEISVKVMPYGSTDDAVKVAYSPAGQYQNGNPFSGDFGTLCGDAVYNTGSNSTATDNTDNAGNSTETDNVDKTGSNGTVTNNADLIYQEMTKGTVADGSGRVRYTTTGIEPSGDKSFDITNKLSEYKTQQSASAFASDFRVLLVSGSTTQKDIEQYLNLLTNGGYSKAVSNKSVTAQSETYKWDGSTFKDTNTSSLVVSNSGSTNLSYAMGKTYDNGNDQFTLLTVTFTSGDHTQVVYVPIIVRRIVEINFKATLNEESIFNDSVYSNLQNHVLVEYDSNMTGYLSWTYNASGTETTEYDWQSYMDSGADLTQGFQKQIVFDCSSGWLPAGAKITLIDTQNQDHVYSYTVTDGDKKSDKQVAIALADFQDASGTKYETKYKETAVSKLYDAKAEKYLGGKFVEADSAESATVVVSTDAGDKYYRLKTEGDAEKDTFKITLNNAKAVTENYYIVVNVPKTSAESKKIASINGTVNSTVTTSAPCNITKVRRIDNSVDQGANTESTFSILSSYTQALEDKSDDGVKQMSDENRTISIYLLDTITFDTDQAYGPEDKLYQEFIATPYNNDQALSFLTDAGTVSFKVYSQDASGGNKQYYKTVSSSDKTLTTADNGAVCASYGWASKDGKMTLILGTANNADSAIDLSKVRADIMASSDKTKKICVEVTLSLKLADNSYNELVPASSLENGSGQPKNSLRLDYISKLARTANDFSASTWRGSCSGTSRYYKEDSGALNLKFEGDDIKQLGINLNDLKNNKSQVIDATASIDFNNWSGWKDAVDEAEKIIFTFHLEQKGNDKNYSKVSISDYLDSMKVGIWSQDDYNYTADGIVKNQDENSWSFTQTKTNEKFANLNDGIFSLPVEYAVNISTKQKDFQYANYRLVVTVSMYDKYNNPVTMLDQSSLSDYVTYTVARVLKSF